LENCATFGSQGSLVPCYHRAQDWEFLSLVAAQSRIPTYCFDAAALPFPPDIRCNGTVWSSVISHLYPAWSLLLEEWIPLSRVLK
jgi:hypothetical protein